MVKSKYNWRNMTQCYLESPLASERGKCNRTVSGRKWNVLMLIEQVPALSQQQRSECGGFPPSNESTHEQPWITDGPLLWWVLSVIQYGNPLSFDEILNDQKANCRGKHFTNQRNMFVPTTACTHPYFTFSSSSQASPQHLAGWVLWACFGHTLAAIEFVVIKLPLTVFIWLS